MAFELEDEELALGSPFQLLSIYVAAPEVKKEVIGVEGIKDSVAIDWSMERGGGGAWRWNTR